MWYSELLFILPIKSMLNHRKEDCIKRVVEEAKTPVENEKDQKQSKLDPIINFVSNKARGIINAIMTKKVTTKYPEQGAYRTAPDREEMIPSRLAGVVRNGESKFKKLTADKRAIWALAVAGGLGAAAGVKWLADEGDRNVWEIQQKNKALCEKDTEGKWDEKNRLCLFSYEPPVAIKMIPSLETSKQGWFESQNGVQGSFVPGQTVNVTSQNGVTAVCAVLYGPNNMIHCEDGSCEWYNPLKSVLALRHGQNPDNLSYVAGMQGLKDAASDLVACTIQGSDSCEKEFLSRGTVINNTLQDNEAVGINQSQIACALIK